MQTDEEALGDDLENLALDRPPSPLRSTEIGDTLTPTADHPLATVNDNETSDDNIKQPHAGGAENVRFGKPISRASASRKTNRGRKKSCLKSPKVDSGLTTTSRSSRVTFPEGDAIIKERIDAEDPWKNVREISVSQLVNEYKLACEKLKIKVNDRARKQIQDLRATACRLENFILTGVKLDERACESLEAVFRKVQFEYIELENCGLEEEGACALFEMIEFYQSTYRLNISCNQKLSYRGWQAACRMLKRTPCLYHLDARRTFLTDQTMPIFGRCLKVNMHLRVLQLEDSYLTGRPMLLLMTAMKYNKHLEELYLGHNDLTHSDASGICAMLTCNTTLQLLDVRNNALKDTGVASIGQGLANQSECHMGGLSSLILWNNGVTQVGLAGLNEAMAKSTSLKSLNVGQNKFGDAGIQRLKPGLMRNKSIQKLGLLNTKLGNEGAVAIAEVLADSSSLTRIDVRGNRINVAGLMAISLALKVNKTLTRLDLDKDLKREQGMESVQQSVLADIYNYCYRNKQASRENSRRQISVSEESSCSSTYSEDEFAIEQYTSTESVPDATDGELETEIQVEPHHVALESSPVMPPIPAPCNNGTSEMQDAPLVTLPQSVTGRSRFQITRIIETVGHGINVSANVANKLVSNVGIDAIAKSAARKLSRGEKEMCVLPKEDEKSADQELPRTENKSIQLSEDSKATVPENVNSNDGGNSFDGDVLISDDRLESSDTDDHHLDVCNGNAAHLPLDVEPPSSQRHQIAANTGIIVVD